MVWDERFAAQRAAFDGAALLERLEAHRLPVGFCGGPADLGGRPVPGDRAASGNSAALAEAVPEL